MRDSVPPSSVCPLCACCALVRPLLACRRHVCGALDCAARLVRRRGDRPDGQPAPLPRTRTPRPRSLAPPRWCRVRGSTGADAPADEGPSGRERRATRSARTVRPAHERQARQASAKPTTTMHHAWAREGRRSVDARPALGVSRRSTSQIGFSLVECEIERRSRRWTRRDHAHRRVSPARAQIACACAPRESDARLQPWVWTRDISAAACACLECGVPCLTSRG